MFLLRTGVSERTNHITLALVYVVNVSKQHLKEFKPINFFSFLLIKWKFCKENVKMYENANTEKALLLKYFGFLHLLKK